MRDHRHWSSGIARAWSVAHLSIPYATLLLPIIGILAIFPRWRVDDAYITFRYAQNLAHYGQLTWNVGENPVEGYTGILMPLMLAVLDRLGLQPEQASHAIGVLSLVLCIVGLVVFLEQRRVSRSIILGSAWILATAPFLYTHALSGLETMLFAVLLLYSFMIVDRITAGGEGARRTHGQLAILLLLLALTRPEGAALALVAPAFTLARARRHHQLRHIVSTYGALLYLPGLAYFLWRWSYYGNVLPNTFYVKGMSGGSISSIRSLYHFGRDYLLVPVIASLAILLLFRRTPHLWEGRARDLARPPLGIFVTFSSIVVAVYSVSMLTMNFSYRFFAPFYPVALVFLTLHAGRALNGSWEVSRRTTTARKMSVGILIACLILQLSLNARWLVYKELPYTRGYKRLLASEHIPIGNYLRHHLPSSEWLAVYFDAGAIPYFAGLKTLDFGSLNDEHLAHGRDLTPEERVDYFFSKNPGALVFTSFESDRPDRGPRSSQEVAGRIVEDPRFGIYVLLHRYECSEWPNYYEFLYVRSDLLGREGDGKETRASS